MALFDSAMFAPDAYSGIGGLLGRILQMVQANPVQSQGFQQDALPANSQPTQGQLPPQMPQYQPPQGEALGLLPSQSGAMSPGVQQQGPQAPQMPQAPGMFGQGLQSGLFNIAGILNPQVGEHLMKQQLFQQQQSGMAATRQALIAKGVPPQIATAAALNPEVMKTMAPDLFGGPKIVPYGSSMVKPNGEVVFNNMQGSANLDQPTLEAMARQYRAGDTTVMQNLGRGIQGAQNIVALRAEIARQNAQEGISGEEQAAKNAEFFGTKAGQRTLGNRQAQIELAATEFQKVTPVVVAASDAVDRTRFPSLNAIIQAAERGTGDEGVVKLASGVNTLVNLYARAISPSGIPTVSDKDHAREILNAAWTKGQFNAAIGMMQQEISAALTSPGQVRDEMRKRFLGGQGSVNSPPAIGPVTGPIGQSNGLPQGWSVQVN